MVSRVAPKFSWFRNWWWVGTFCLMAMVVYAHGMRARGAALEELRNRLSEMEKQCRFALQEKEDLALQIASQSDPAWIELILLRQIGVVPEGFLKVHFKNLSKQP